MRHINKAYIITLDNSWKCDKTQGLSEEKYLGKLKVNMGDRPRTEDNFEGQIIYIYDKH